MDIKDIRELYKRLRKDRIVLTYGEFSEKMGYHRTYISRVLNGHEPLTKDIIDRINSTSFYDTKNVPHGTSGSTKPFTVKTDLDKFIGERTEISNAIEAAVRVLKVKLVEIEAKITKRPFSSVSLEFDRLMQDELKQIEADMKKKYS